MPVLMPVNTYVTGALVWVMLTFAAAGSTAMLNYTRLRGDFDAEARTLHRIVSQRADQHDAHLTSLAALLASPDSSFTTLRAVTEAVQRFYPRIKGVEVLTTGDDPEVTFSTHAVSPIRNPAEISAVARDLLPGQAAVTPVGDSETYDLVKRLPASNPQAGTLVMTIDGRRLVEPEGTPVPGIQLTLRQPSGRDIIQVGELAISAAPAFTFEKVLGSRSQPLLLVVGQRPLALEILPPIALALAFAGAALSVLIGFVVVGERRAAREARDRASFHQNEARLAHAMRVNTVGEMASGIAHELTQPLTAILSQSQAGLRMALRPIQDREAMIGVLEANARLAKRAGDILARLRAYVSNKAPVPEETNLNQVVLNVVDLVKTEMAQRGVALALDLSHDAPTTMIDRVSIEQVVHNLLRNAADAVEHLPQERRTIAIATARDGGGALICVRDNGSGISTEGLVRVFEPFYSTKAQGMGLGLPLCERLVEAFGGNITVANHASGGAVFTVRLPVLKSVTGEVAA